MHIRDQFHYSFGAIFKYPMRSFLTSLGIAIGIAAVVLLTSIGQGIQHFVLQEFTQFGTNLIAVNPGKTTTMGTPLGVLGTVRPLSMQDALALEEIPQVEAVLPAVSGNAEVEGNNRQRRVTVIGVNHTMPQVFSMQVAGGQFLPQDDPVSPRAFAVLGYKLRVELFGDRNPLGERIRIGGSRFLVVGTMESKGQVLGFDLDDTVYIPTVRAQELFNQEGLMEIDVLYEETADVDTMVRRIKRLLNARHGQEDYTITTQQQMLDVLGSVLDVLTFAVMALGSISLLVGGVGILTIMSIAVTERTSEVGLLRALGARQNSIVLILLVEAAGLSAIGGLAGLAIGVGGGQLLGTLVPGLPVKTPWDFVIIAEVLAIAIGIVAGILPARRAAKMDPVEALRTE